MAMLFGSDLLRRMTDVGMRVLGNYGQLMTGSKWAIGQAAIARNYLASLSIGVEGPTRYRNIIAMRGLGLPEVSGYILLRRKEGTEWISN
jgi:hypothetical protein